MLKAGDHIRVLRPQRYHHHGIYVGAGKVIHYSGELIEKSRARVKRTSLSRFLNGGDLEVLRYRASYEPRSVVRRAGRRLHEKEYDLFHNNCEHFASWCRTGEARSRQVEKAERVARELLKIIVGGPPLPVLPTLESRALALVARRVERELQGDATDPWDVGTDAARAAREGVDRGVRRLLGLL